MAQVKRKKKKKNRGALTFLIIIIIIAGIAFVGYNFFQVKNIVFNGCERYDQEYLTKLSGVEMGRNILMIDKKDIMAKMESDPYLDIVDISRHYPNELIIDIKERKPACVAEYHGSFFVLDGECNILGSASQEDQSKLPLVYGLKAESMQIGNPVISSEDYQIVVIENILASLGNVGITTEIAKIDVALTGDLTMYTLDGFTVKLGQNEEIENKMKTLKAVLDELRKEGLKSGTIDITSNVGASYLPSAIPDDTPLDNDTTDGTDGDSKGSETGSNEVGTSPEDTETPE